MPISVVFVMSCGGVIIGVARTKKMAEIWLHQNTDDDGYIRSGLFRYCKDDVVITKTDIVDPHVACYNTNNTRR